MKVGAENNPKTGWLCNHPSSFVYLNKYVCWENLSNVKDIIITFRGLKFPEISYYIISTTIIAFQFLFTRSTL